MTAAPSPILDTLNKAVAGLTYPSESDEPFVAFCWPAAAAAPKPAGAAKPDSAKATARPSPKAAAGPPAVSPVGDPVTAARARVAAHAAGRAIREVPIDRFFADLDAADDAERYRQLRHVLESELAGLQVFRVGDGEVKVDIYLIGRARTGEWAGVQTASVET